MTINIPHQLTKTETHTRVRKLLDKIKSQFGDKIENFEEDWKDDMGSFKFSIGGQPVSGSIRLFETTVQVDIELPFIASFF